MSTTSDHGEVLIRPIRAADDDAIARIIREVMTEHGAVGEGFAIVDPEVSEMSRAYAGSGAGYFVLDRDGTILGGAGYAALAGATQEICELRKMYLLTDARGGGLGRRLLAHVLAAAKLDGYRRCYLETLATMQRARALYEANGFLRLCAPQGKTGHYGCDAWYAREL